MKHDFFAKAATIGVASALCLALTAAAYADSSNRVKFVKRVSLQVGQAMVFHGLRGECGKLPDKAQMQKSLDAYNAKLKTGRLQYGKPGIRGSGQCNGDTPVMETLFVGTTPGRERVDIYGDTVLFIVK
ncbi:MAG: hypothetical protein V2I76_14480 [Roseobacter sp.]|jgi:hypothetical protein|nr:hypothetical protein [Roseobacter sp.]